MFTVYSNYTQIAEVETLREALALALSESWTYDDVLMIEEGGVITHFVKSGALYRAALDPSLGADHTDPPGADEAEGAGDRG